jgi:superfamily II DNA or RNA helicase
MNLRPYQLAADAAITRELETLGRRATMLVMATGTGKTVSFVAWVARNRLRGGRSLILADRDELIQQPRRKLEALGIDADVEKASRRASLNAKVVIASVQSLRGARLARFPRDHFDLVIADECDLSMAPTWRAILDHFAAAKVLGVTATPLRADGQALGVEGGGLYESVAYRYEIRDAIRDGHLVPIRARRIVLEGVDLSAVRTRAGDLAQDQLAALLETERAITGVVDPLLELAGERPTVVFGVDVAHAESLAAKLNERRPGCARSISGESADREELLEAYQAGAFQFLCNCALLVRGWDAPLTSCIAIARPTKSWALHTQMVGRGTRLSPETGKRDLLILSFTGQAGRHRLMGPADCLIGSEQGPDALADDLRAELDRLLGTQALDLETVLASAAADVAARRRMIAAGAIVKFHAEQVDPFLGPEPVAFNGGPQLDIGWANRPVTEAQSNALDTAGVTLSKLPPSFSMADATRLLVRIKARRDAGLCSLAQAKRIAQGTNIDTRAMTFNRASELIQLLRHGSWRPNALFGTPEFLAAANARPHDTVRISATRSQWHGRGLTPDAEDHRLDHEALP